MALQTTYGDTIRKGVPGQIADMRNSTLISKTVENAAGIDFGAPVSPGAADEGCILTTTGSTLILGAAVRERSLIAATNKFSQYDSARIMTTGLIWVLPGEDVADNDPVYVTVATALWKKTSSGNVLVPNSLWKTTTTLASGLPALLALNLPG